MDKYGVRIKGIIRCNDEFLIIKKWMDDRIDEPYQWQFFDTTMMEDESPADAALRYILECTGIYANVTCIPYTWTYKLGDNRYIGIAFLCDVPDTVVIMSEEISEIKWVKAEELDKYITYKSMLRDMHEAGIF